MKMTSRLFKFLSLSTVWLWLGVFALLPNLALLLVAFLNQDETNYFVPVMTLQNYLRLLDPSFLSMLWSSIWLAAASTFLCLLVGYPFAYNVARAKPEVRPFLLLLVIIPFWTNSLIRTFALIIILKSKGLLSNLLLWLGFTSTDTSFLYSNFAVFLGLTYTFLPFMILPLYASIEKLDRNLLLAAKDLGAGSLRTFWHITLPLTMPGIVAGSILVFLPGLGCFYIPELLGGGTSMLLGNFIKDQFLTSRDWPMGAASSTLLTIILILMVLIYRLVTLKIADKEDSVEPVHTADNRPGNIFQDNV